MSNKIKCSHILVQKQSKALAVLERIKNGEKFGKLAKELSIDSGSAKRDATWAILVTNLDKIMKNALWFANHHRIGTPEREYIAKSISEFIDNKMQK